MASANSKLIDYMGTGNYYKYINGLYLTDGVKALVEQFHGMGFIREIALAQVVLPRIDSRNMQVWTMKCKEGIASLICTDGNYVPLFFKEEIKTDFAEDEGTICVKGGVLYLPSEH